MTEEWAEEEGWRDFELAIKGAIAGVVILAIAMLGSLCFWWW